MDQRDLLLERRAVGLVVIDRLGEVENEVGDAGRLGIGLLHRDAWNRLELGDQILRDLGSVIATCHQGEAGYELREAAFHPGSLPCSAAQTIWHIPTSPATLPRRPDVW